MLHRRPTAIAGLMLALLPAGAMLSSCGFDYPTDRVNTIGAGVSDRDASVDALGIRVLATAQGEGRLIGSLTNNTEDEASLDAVTSPEGVAEADEFSPIDVAGRRGVNLADQDPITLTGDFTAGEVISLELEFSTGETVSLGVPVVKPCFQYTQVPAPSQDASAAEDETAGAAAEEQGEEIEEDATDQASDGASDGASEDHADSHDATFTCDHPTEEGGH